MYSWYKIYIHPIVYEYWANMQAEYIDNVRGFIKLTGDGQVWYFLF
jgi:acylphosphatase